MFVDRRFEWESEYGNIFVWMETTDPLYKYWHLNGPSAGTLNWSFAFQIENQKIDLFTTAKVTTRLSTNNNTTTKTSATTITIELQIKATATITKQKYEEYNKQ